MPTFGAFEKRILSYFTKGTEIFFKGKKVRVIEADKLTCSHGEPKTDIYISVTDGNKQEEIKISYKKENADFLENKTNAERAEQLLGTNWRVVIESSTREIKEKFEQRFRIYKESFKRTQKGAITLGWKFELLNKPGGDLSAKINLNKKQVYDVYAGTNLSAEKRNAFVNGRMIINSGVADYILVSDEVDSAQDVINQMESIWEYIEKNPDIYFACKALNYRTFHSKWDGNRPLAVQVYWHVENNKLCSDLIFDAPLEMNGNEMAQRLITCLKYLSIKTTDDIDDNNADMKNTYE